MSRVKFFPAFDKFLYLNETELLYGFYEGI